MPFESFPEKEQPKQESTNRSDEVYERKELESSLKSAVDSIPLNMQKFSSCSDDTLKEVNRSLDQIKGALSSLPSDFKLPDNYEDQLAAPPVVECFVPIRSQEVLRVLIQTLEERGWSATFEAASSISEAGELLGSTISVHGGVWASRD